MTAGEALEERLARISVDYKVALPERSSQLVDAATRWVDDLETGDGIVRLKELHNLAHRLTGSSAAFKFSDLSKVAFELEDACQQKIGSGDPADHAPTPDRIMALVKKVGVSIRKIAGDSDLSIPLNDDAREINTLPGKEKAVVLVTANDETASLVCNQLERFDYVITVIDSTQGLAGSVAQLNPVAVIIEATMYGDQFQGADDIKAALQQSPTPPDIIIISDRDDLLARLAAVRAGCDRYILQPLDPMALVDVLDSAVEEDKGEPYRVVIVDDDDDIGEFVQTLLSEVGMDVRWLKEPDTLIETVSGFSPELILMDLYLANCTGQELAAVLRQKDRFSSIPIVYLSGEQNETVQMGAMEQGGDDFLTKPINPDHLIRSVENRINRFRRLRERMVRDGLTNLYNHTTMKQFLNNEVLRAQRHDGKLSYAILDIDHFKSVNDTYGHGIGDMVLKTLSRMLRQRLRASDIVGRIGGEEFGVILSDTSIEQAVQVIEEVRISFEAIAHSAGDARFNVTFSGGLAQFGDFSNAVDLAEAADKALYEAKNNGRNRVIMASSA